MINKVNKENLYIQFERYWCKLLNQIIKSNYKPLKVKWNYIKYMIS